MVEPFDFKKIRTRVIRRMDDLKPYERNPRTNSEALPYLVESIRQFGMNVPLVIDKNNVLVCGHTRFRACQELGFEEVECVLLDDLTPAQVNAFRLADNKIPEYSGWDFDMLDLELEDIQVQDNDLDMSDFGFLDDSISSDEEEDPSEELFSEPEEEIFSGEDINENKVKTMPGDIYLLGQHRIICGDSTSDDVLNMLMSGNKAKITFTSPPYNAGNIGTGRPENGQKYVNDPDSRTDSEYSDFLIKSVEMSMRYTEYEVMYNIGLVSGSKKAIVDLLSAEIDHYMDQIYWLKANPSPTIKDTVISSGIEPIFVFGPKSSRSFHKSLGIWYGVISGAANTGNQFSKIHRAVFPLYLPTEIMNRISDEGDIVLDPFLGVGTSLIAAEDTGRICYGVEMEPLYCDACVERYIKRIGSDEDVWLIRKGKKIHYSDL